MILFKQFINLNNLRSNIALIKLNGELKNQNNREDAMMFKNISINNMKAFNFNNKKKTVLLKIWNKRIN